MPIFGASYDEPDETPEERERWLAETQKKIEAIVAKSVTDNPELVALWAHAAGRLVGDVMVNENLPPSWIERVQAAMLRKLAQEAGMSDG